LPGQLAVFDCLINVRRIHIAYADYLHVRIAGKRSHIAAPLPARADQSEADSVIRAENVAARAGQHGASGDSRFDKVSTFDPVVH
jgi:hypothetical protein